MKLWMQKSSMQPQATNKIRNNLRVQLEGNLLGLMTKNLGKSATKTKTLKTLSRAPLPETLRPLNKSANSLTSEDKDRTEWGKTKVLCQSMPLKKYSTGTLTVVRAVQGEIPWARPPRAWEAGLPGKPRTRPKFQDSAFRQSQPPRPPLPNSLGRESPTDNNAPMEALQEAYGVTPNTHSGSLDAPHATSPTPKPAAKAVKAGLVAPAWLQADLAKGSQWDSDDDDWDIASQMENGAYVCFFHNDDAEPTFPTGTGDLSPCPQGSARGARSMEPPPLDPELERLQILLNDKARRTLRQSWLGPSHEAEAPRKEAPEKAASETKAPKGKKRGARQRKGASAPNVTTESVPTACRPHWQRFSAWCLTKGYNPLRSTSEAISEFMAHLVHVEKRSKLSVARALHALAAALRTQAGVDISKDLTLQSILAEAGASDAGRACAGKALGEGQAVWDLGVVLQALKGPPFEPLETASFRMLTLKTALLTALASGRHCVDVHAIDVFTSKHHTCWSWIHCKTVYPHFSR